MRNTSARHRTLLVALLVSLVVAGFLWFMQSAMVPPGSSQGSPPGNSARITPSATDPETGGVPAAADDRAIANERSVAKATGATLAKTETAVLRVVVEGITEEDARMTRVTLTGVDERRDDWPSHIKDSWPCQGLSS